MSMLLLLAACLAAAPDKGTAATPTPGAALPPSGRVASPEGQTPQVDGWKGNPSVMVVAAGVAKPEFVAFASQVGAKVEVLTAPATLALVWTPPGTPKGILVSLHGTTGWAYAELALWQPYAAEHGLAVVALQWWDGTSSEKSNYLPPLAAYNAISGVIRKDFGDNPPPVIFHGFSRGSANSYAIVAWDRVSTKPMFTAVISNSGGYQSDYPPNKRIVAGGFGSQPFKGLKWVLACGTNDPRPDMDGCPAMTRTRTFLEGQGTTPTIIQVSGGHGSFHNDHDSVEKALSLVL